MYNTAILNMKTSQLIDQMYALTDEVIHYRKKMGVIGVRKWGYASKKSFGGSNLLLRVIFGSF